MIPLYYVYLSYHCNYLILNSSERIEDDDDDDNDDDAGKTGNGRYTYIPLSWYYVTLSDAHASVELNAFRNYFAVKLSRNSIRSVYSRFERHQTSSGECDGFPHSDSMAKYDYSFSRLT